MGQGTRRKPLWAGVTEGVVKGGEGVVKGGEGREVGCRLGKRCQSFEALVKVTVATGGFSTEE